VSEAERIEALEAERDRLIAELGWKIVVFGLSCAALGGTVVWALHQ